MNESPGKEVLPVSVSLLDKLMNLAGELVLGRNQLVQGIGESNMKAIELSGHRIDMITSELQETVMKTRMQPVGGLFGSLKDVATGLCLGLGKVVDTQIQGGEVELDTTIIDGIREPLEGLVDYCIRHGIESPEKRAAAGKSGEGQLRLAAYNEAGQVNITVADDGCGAFIEPIPGFCTGGIETMGGILETEALPAQGSRIRIKIPLTLTIIPSQIASVGREKYAIPQTNLEELIRISGDEIRERIEKVGDADVVRLRGDLLPILNLPDILGIEKSYTDPDTGREVPERRKNISDRRARKYSAEGVPVALVRDGDQERFQDRQNRDRRKAAALNIAVVFAGSFRYGMVIDQLHDSEEIVVKPLGRHMNGCKAYAGATIMGDGRVALILDILNLAQMGGLSTRQEADQIHKETTELSEKTSVVVFKNQETEYFAVPFDSVERIERVQTSDIEQVGTRRVVQYRGGTLALYELSGMINVAPLQKRPFQEIIVFREKDREFGLMVTPPVDTVDTALVLDEDTLKQKGIKGSAIINNRTTLCIDVAEMAAHFGV